MRAEKLELINSHKRTIWQLGRDWLLDLARFARADLILRHHTEVVLVSLEQANSLVREFIHRQLGEVEVIPALRVALLDYVAGDGGATVAQRGFPLEDNVVVVRVDGSQILWWFGLIWKARALINLA